jgi:5-methyltetrahydrofolate--homocysteine methyltransferase
MGSRFAARGRPKGRVVLGNPPGERHSIPTAMVADMLRSAGFEPINLGADTPVESFLEAVAETGAIAVGLSISSGDALGAAADVAAAVHEETGLPVVMGGRAVRDAAHASELGADGYAADGAAAVEWVRSLVG